jgi:hypothetical protein
VHGFHPQQQQQQQQGVPQGSTTDGSRPVAAIDTHNQPRDQYMRDHDHQAAGDLAAIATPVRAFHPHGNHHHGSGICGLSPTLNFTMAEDF